MYVEGRDKPEKERRKMKTARIQVNGDITGREKPRYVVIFEEVSEGVRIDLKVRHYASLKAAERAAAKYTEAA